MAGPMAPRARLNAGDTLNAARERPWVAADDAVTGLSAVRTPRLPTDVVADSASRLRVLAWIYVGTFFVVGPAMAFLTPAQRSVYFDDIVRWGPPTISILGALAIAVVTHRAHLTPTIVQTVGLGFEILGAYGIAAARYLSPQPTVAGPTAVSWVAVWILVFATLIPSPPRRAFVAALLAATAVPVMAVSGLAAQGVSPSGGMLRVAIGALVPYLVVAAIAATAARVVYRLGTQITHARELGAYHLVERLGEGGMGEVWRAKHRWLARPAAIKLIRESDGAAPQSADARMRFEQEAQVTASLRSLHTVQVYDFGVTDDGAFYYVMELLDGFDLETLVERFGPVPIERAVYLLRQVCDSLAEAHERGVVHRDIKPSNIYVCRYGRDVDVVKVLDFGLVKAIGGYEGATQMAITAEAVARGTPAFMSPEQALADPTLDARSDLYALGCVAFWLVTGKPVFTGNSPIDTIVKHVHTPAEAPSRFTELPIPEDFDALVLALLAKDRSMRPPSADAVLARAEAIDLGRVWTSADAHAWWRSHLPPAEGPGDARRS